MKWEDTVMSDEAIKQELLKYDIPEVYVTADIAADLVGRIGNIIAAARKAQAKVAFEAGIKAGIKQGYTIGLTDGQRTNHKRHGKKMRQARLEGRQEVVDWVRLHQLPDNPSSEPYRGIVVMSKVQVEAKLKEWDID